MLLRTYPGLPPWATIFRPYRGCDTNKQFHSRFPPEFSTTIHRIKQNSQVLHSLCGFSSCADLWVHGRVLGIRGGQCRKHLGAPLRGRRGTGQQRSRNALMCVTPSHERNWAQRERHSPQEAATPCGWRGVAVLLAPNFCYTSPRLPLK